MRGLTAEAKDMIVSKSLNCTDGQSFKDMAKSYNVGYSTLKKWIKKYKDQAIQITPKASRKVLGNKEKLAHLLSTANLDEHATGAYCRERGLYGLELQQWKEEFMTPSCDEKYLEIKQQLKLLKTENHSLKQELYRKEKALAETAALLVLKKKADYIWGENPGDLSVLRSGQWR
jgi:transposase-like protein